MAEELAARLGRLSLQAGADAEVVASPVAFKPSDLAGLDDVLGTLREVRTSTHVDRIPKWFQQLGLSRMTAQVRIERALGTQYSHSGPQNCLGGGLADTVPERGGGIGADLPQRRALAWSNRYRQDICCVANCS